MRLTTKSTEYLIQLGQNGSSNTVATYGTAIAQFQGYLVSIGRPDDVRQFTPDNVEGFAAFLAGQGTKASTRRNRLTALSSFAGWLMTQKDPGTGHYLLPENPFSRIIRPRAPKPKTTFLYAHEVHALMATASAPEHALVRDLFLDTGLRVTEVAESKVGDLWNNQGQTYLHVHLKGGSEREVPIGPDVAARLRASLEQRGAAANPSAPLLVNTHGKKFTRQSLSAVLYRMGKRAGVTRVPVRPHKLRHTYNVVARTAGLDAVVRAELLNHSGTKTLERYDHLLAHETTAAREQVRNAMKEYAK